MWPRLDLHVHPLIYGNYRAITVICQDNSILPILLENQDNSRYLRYLLQNINTYPVIIVIYIGE